MLLGHGANAKGEPTAPSGENPKAGSGRLRSGPVQVLVKPAAKKTLQGRLASCIRSASWVTVARSDPSGAPLISSNRSWRRGVRALAAAILGRPGALERKPREWN